MTKPLSTMRDDQLKCFGNFVGVVFASYLT